MVDAGELGAAPVSTARRVGGSLPVFGSHHPSKGPFFVGFKNGAVVTICIDISFVFFIYELAVSVH